MSFAKRSAPGQKSRARNSRERKAGRPPKGEPWVWHTRELLRSDAWRTRSINCVRLLEFLEIEHMNNAGTENGNLAAPYDQLVTHGLRRQRISAAIKEAEFLGLLRCERGGRIAGSNQPSRYRLTYLQSRDRAPATNEWKRVTEEQIDCYQREQQQQRRARRAWRDRDRDFLQKVVVLRSNA